MRSFLIFCSLVGLLSITTQNAIAQDNNPYTPDPRLSEIMDAATLATCKPELILYYNYFLNNSFYVVSLTHEKPVTGIDIHTVKVKNTGDEKVFFSEKSFDPKTFNVMKYQFEPELTRFVTYIWKEAGVALVFHPQRHLQAAFKNYQKELSAR